jgi:putative PIN family toxin of toxin-antitoxin system
VRVVIDTNVLISAIFWSGKPKQLLNQVRRGKIIFLTAEVLLVELKEVLTRRDKPFKLSEEEAHRILTQLRNLGEIIEPHSLVTTCRDDADNRVLECAVDGRAEWIVTGDSDLLDLEVFQGIKIAAVADFLSAVSSPW